MKTLFTIITLTLLSVSTLAAQQPEFSTAGFYSLKNTGREVYNMNVAWRFQKGDIQYANAKSFDDKEWQVVSLPHGIDYLPLEASGCINYQGIVWYRKHFTPDEALKGKKLFLHFEAIMGKCKVWVNGKLLTEHFGGFLPVIADVTEALTWGEDNVIAVMADNSNDPGYPPGKAQEVLDFSYFGGIYRDCFLIAHNNVFLTDPNYENETAGGGVFVAFDKVSEKYATVLLKAHVRNAGMSSFSGSVEYEFVDAAGNKMISQSKKIRIDGGIASASSTQFTVKAPRLWSPDSPYLYDLHVRIRDNKGKIVDGYRRRIGIRGIEFKGKDGFWLNGKPYEEPLIGANRHQDFAVVGNALSNSTHWRDAKKLRDAGCKVIRNAHYPQDPSFMDACDELGLFVIVNTPGWQFWNEAPLFEQRVYSDIRNMVRRDRNHPSVWLWEPILNETWYPDYFAINTKNIVDEEYPYSYCYSGCDNEARGKENFPVLFTHPSNSDGKWAIKELDPSKTYFTREWGDNVDDWNSHNSPSRVARNWGEQPMLVQSQHYANPPYTYTSYEALFHTSRQHVGGTLWHSFDHQRGYHPDPFYGGLMDVFRQPKYSYYMFMAQRDPQKSGLIAENGPMVYIAHEMTPFSSQDVTVYSNCEEVRLTVNNGGKTYTYKKDGNRKGMPSPIITFKDVFSFMTNKELSRSGKQKDVFLLAEGLMGGRIVASHKVEAARRPEKIMLWVDNEGVDLEANGSDFVPVIAAITDKNGNIKRLNNYSISFQISGEGRLLGGSSIMANPAPVRWGTAPILVQSTTVPGTIKITATVLFQGSQMPLSGELEIKTKESVLPLAYSDYELVRAVDNTIQSDETSKSSHFEREIEKLQKELNQLKLKEVERQQNDFGEQR